MGKRTFNWNSMPVNNRPTSLESRQRKTFKSGSFRFQYFDISEGIKTKPMPIRNPFIGRKSNVQTT